MSWSLESYSTSMTLTGVADDPAFKQLLTKFASSILPDLLADDDHDLWSAFDCVRDEVEDAGNESDALEALVEEIESYLSCITYEDGKVSFDLGSEYDTDAPSEDLVEALAEFLLPYATTPYLVMSSASFDKHGGYAHQSLLYRTADGVVQESVTAVLERLFANLTAPAGTLLTASA